MKKVKKVRTMREKRMKENEGEENKGEENEGEENEGEEEEGTESILRRLLDLIKDLLEEKSQVAMGI